MFNLTAASSALCNLKIKKSPQSDNCFDRILILSRLQSMHTKLHLSLFLSEATTIYKLHSPSKCLAWVKNCCHIWLDQNFDPSLLTNKLWLNFMGKKQKKNFFFEKKKFKMADSKKQRFSKSPILKKFSRKFHRLVLGFSRIDWCEGHWCGSIYIVMRLTDICSKIA